MDGLALLCNLHADGPVSLRRLRRAGVCSLVELELSSESTLAAVLHASPNHVRRLVGEARQLAERLGERKLEPEIVPMGSEAQEALFDPVEPADAEPLHSISLDEALEVASAHDFEVEIDEDDADVFVFDLYEDELEELEDEPAYDEPQELADETAYAEPQELEELELARPGAGSSLDFQHGLVPVGYDLQPVEEDDDLPVAEIPPAQVVPREPPEVRPIGSEEQALLVEPLEAARARSEPLEPVEMPRTPQPDFGAGVDPEPLSEGTPIRRGEIRGLDGRTCELLVREGVRTYRSLIDLASLTLARRMGIPYTRLLELRAAARSFLERRLGSTSPRIARQGPAPAESLAIREEREEPVHVLVPLPPRARAQHPSPHPPSAERPDPLVRGREIVLEDPGVAGPFV